MASPIGKRFVLVIGSESRRASISCHRARRWIDAGASYVCAWGPSANAIEESFDYASFMPEYGEPLPFTFMTTSHEEGSLEQALWFAFWCSAPPEDLNDELSSVLVVVDTPALRDKSKSWISANTQ